MKLFEAKHETVENYFVDLSLPDSLTEDDAREMHRKMCLIRRFDETVRELWMQGDIHGVAHAYIGEEAIAVGACAAIRPDDLITSTHRGHGHTIGKGADVGRMMAELLGKYEGYNHGKGGSMHIADVEHGMLGATGIVGSSLPLAAGAAYAMDYLETGNIVLCFFGDGAINQGVWHEALNIGAAWNLPVVYLAENNGIAISTDICSTTKEHDIFMRAVAYGIPSILADGLNPFDVYEAVRNAAARARNGQGPTLVDARCIRFMGHFVADEQPYRDMEKLKPLWQNEPLVRMRDFLIKSGICTEAEVNEIEQKAFAEIADAVDFAKNHCTEPGTEMLYTDLYANGEIIK